MEIILSKILSELELANVKSYHLISNIYYQIGEFHFKQKELQLILDPLQKSCDILATYLEKIDSKNDVNSNDMEEIQIKLSKRYEMLGSYQHQLSNIKVRCF